MEQGHWALVTGATGGIGRAYCKLLAERGWSLVVAGRNHAKLKRLAEELKAQGTRVFVAVADLSVPEGPERLAGVVDGLGIEPELLVNNAGLGYTAPFTEVGLARQRALVQLDVTSVMELAHIFARRMAAAGKGSIVNVASVAGTMPGPGMATYYASKAFVLSLSQALHEELAGCGVRMLAVCPGPVRTGFWDVAGTDLSAKEAFMLSPEEVARISLVALDRNRAVCAPGLVSKACYAFGRSMPGVLSRKVAGLFDRQK